jgi:hypothetical protein
MLNVLPALGLLLLIGSVAGLELRAQLVRRKLSIFGSR